MRDFIVYLAGPIDGLTYGDGQSWRDYISAKLPSMIRGASPLRAKSQALVRVGVITNSYENNPLTSQHGLTSRDRFDVSRCDLMIANFLGAKKVSTGTAIEFGWADAYRKPVIMVMEKEDNVHDHPMIRDIASYRVETLDQAVEIAIAVLLPEGEVPQTNTEQYSACIQLDKK